MKKLPKNWIEVELEEICLPVENTSPTEVEHAYIDYIDISSIDNKTFQIKNAKRVNWVEAPSRARQKLKRGDTIFSTVRTYLKNIAKIEEDFEFPVASTGFAVIRPSNFIDNNFIFYHLINEDFVSKTIEKQTGTSYPAIRSREFFKLRIVLPPLAEQRLIVTKLEAAMEQLRAAEAILVEMPELIADFRRSVLDWAVTGKLTEKWRRKNTRQSRINVEGLLEKIEVIASEKSIALNRKEVLFHEIPFQLPSNWKFVRIGRIAEIIMGQSPSEVV